ncbi:MAG TPA: single-stranded-DNA-specific exonuclease RecJ [Candidatus Paceibacterota bacterium]
MKQWVHRDSHGATLLDKLLESRGVKSESEREQFLHPDFGHDTHDPLLMKDMDLAVARIAGAVKRNERIVVFGDYDADGIPGAAVLHSFFEKIAYENFETYIPDRYSEKYSLAEESLRAFASRGTRVVISVDCGITDVYEATVARELGIDLIITDHHLTPDVLPAAYAVINNKRADDTYPFKYLCGAGTAFKLVQALCRSGKFVVGKEFEREVLDLVAIATVCDMVPLVGENRAIVSEGLKFLRTSERVGIKALCKKLNIKQEFMSEDDIGYLIGPRINISSRMAHGSDALHLLTTHDALLANTIASQLQARNKERRENVEVIMSHVQERWMSHESRSVLVAGHESWRMGVLGLTASRLVENHARPVFLWTRNHLGEIKGSARSDGTVSVVDMLKHAGGDDFFKNFGGHEMAGGFSLDSTRENELPDRLERAYEKAEKLKSEQEKIYYDAELVASEANWQTYKSFEALAPFGKENPKPTFLLTNLELESVKEMGESANHIELTFKDKVGGKPLKAMGFFMTKKDYPNLDFAPGTRLDILFNLEKSYMRGFAELRFRLIDIRSSTGLE